MSAPSGRAMETRRAADLGRALDRDAEVNVQDFDDVWARVRERMPRPQPSTVESPRTDLLADFGAFLAGLHYAAARVAAGYEQALAPLRESSGDTTIPDVIHAHATSSAAPAASSTPFLDAVLDVYDVRAEHRAAVEAFLTSEPAALAGLVVLRSIVAAEVGSQRPRLERVEYVDGDSQLFVWLPFAGAAEERSALLERLDRAWFDTGRAHAARITVDTEPG